ncbi:GlcG/HbpS family heme-binding protein [Trinickia fusca]|uniref:Heme-binding protein n=1 Tax=Trinickia fusca TaxID=2419777 RepID=A0A494X6X9_9BURK|nr:heme-binding protein [Trinickia fusca]RKP43513.1 heme-binding protein [Trinickia fusca]
MNQDTLNPSALRYGAPITLDEARHVAQAAHDEAARQDWPMAIAIVDSGGHLVLLHRLDNTQLGSIEVARQKAETAVRFKRPTKRFEDALTEGGLHWRLLGMTNLTPLDGGIPLVRDGAVIGAIGISGMQSHQDAQVAQAGADALR